MSKQDFYEALGLSKSADEREIKKAYKRLAMKYHPDRTEGDKAAEEKFKQVKEAYEVLSNPQKKAAYDQYGHAGVDPNRGGGGGAQDFGDVFGDVFGDGGSPFDSFFGGGGGRGRSTRSGQKGSNIRIKVKLSLEDVANEVTKNIKVKKSVSCKSCEGSGAKDKSSVSTCGTCGGSGYVRQIKSTFLGQMQTTAVCPNCSGSGQQITAKCGTCKGDGTEMGSETISIPIPAGVEDGMQLSMRGKGNAGKNGGPNGDLLINIEVLESDNFSRDGQNIIHDLYINFADAALGTSIEVPTLSGKVKIKIPEGTQPGKIFRLRGKGLPSVQGYGTGDQLIHVNIWTPKQLNKDEKELLEKMREMPNFVPNPGKEEKGFFERMKDMLH